MIELIKYPDINTLSSILKRPEIEAEQIEAVVIEILKTVKLEGDSALFKYSALFDKISITNFKVNDTEIEDAINSVSNELKDAILQAKNNITIFHAQQKEAINKIETSPGVLCWRKSVAIEKVGLYIPGGSAPLFSTVLMLGIPAQIAGCSEITLCTPADKFGKINPAILFAANLCGIKNIFKIGGAQAIAAMAFGTETVPQVYKIFGPGNQYVTCAKQLITKYNVAIDMPAGPSELAVLADSTCIPSFVAADLLSQAEHGADSQVVLVSNNENILLQIIFEINAQLKSLARKSIAEKALKNSKAILVNTLADGIDILNKYAPEHLILACENNEKLCDKVINAGSVFLGNYSCESAGDYASGTNHTLPTNGNAKSFSGVSLDSFVKKITVQKITEKGIQNIGKSIETMAEAEGLDAHKNAVSVRLKQLKNGI